MPDEIPNIKTDPYSPSALAQLESRSETNRQLAEMNKTLALILDQLKKLEDATRSVATASSIQRR
jgi:hypothetical protein